MKKIIFVTGNQSKLLDAQKTLGKSGLEIVGQKLDFEEKQSLDQEEIVKNKARQAYGMIKLPLFVDDTGFYLDSYPQFPGTITKIINKTLGLVGFIKLFEEGQTAQFKTLVCFVDGKNEILVEGRLTGILTKKVSKNFNQDTPLNSIFIPDGYDKQLADLSEDVGNLHRKRALEKLKVELTSL
jgi:XTP/dITP diphosphohydrolase